MVAIELYQFNALFTLLQQSPSRHHLSSTAIHPHNSATMKTSPAVDFLPFLDQDGKINELANRLYDICMSGVGERSPTPSLADVLDLFQQKDPWFVTDTSHGRQTQSSPKRRRMVRKIRPERAPIQFRKMIHPVPDKPLNHGHATGILIEWLEPTELAEEEFESLEGLFEQYDAKVKADEAGYICHTRHDHAK